MGNQDVCIENMDVRVLTLKRWNLPPRRSIYQNSQDKSKAYGAYVSFQNYHFFDINPVDTSNVNGGHIFTEVYDIATKTKEPLLKDIYVQQNMTIFGEKSAFWDDEAQQCLYVTMIQLSNDKKIQLSDIKTDLEALFKKQNISSKNWALYYTLDFCDLVLLMKDIPLLKVQSILWILAPVREGEFSSIRDTITICGIKNEYLCNQFQLYENPEKQNLITSESEKEKISALITLSVQDLEKWKTLKDKLSAIVSEEKDIQYYRILGRYDIQVELHNITLIQFLKSIYEIDSFFDLSNIEDEAFGCYEAVMLSPYIEQTLNGKLVSMDRRFEKSVATVLETLFEKYQQMLEKNKFSLHGYASVVKNSIIALLKNGFAEEFVLSIFGSFVGYLKFAEYFTEQSGVAPTDKQDLFYKFQKAYFNSLVMLANCTMHGERQFIQAPAFNATLFDIPPKLLAFYAAIADKIKQVLDDEDGKRSFFFLFSPDFRPDIYVSRICGKEDSKYEIYIIYLNEKMFYDPTLVVETMCHEIAHYVGKHSRLRQKRAEAILDCICAYVLYNALSNDKDELWECLIQSFRTQILEEYDHWIENRSNMSQRKYYLTNISCFLKSGEVNYLMELFNNEEFTNALQQKWTSAIIRKEVDVLDLINQLEKTLRTGYLEKLYLEENTRKAAVHVLAGFLVIRVKYKIKEFFKSTYLTQDRNYIEFYENIFQVFSEGYCDLRMTEILDIADKEVYLETLNRHLDVVGGKNKLKEKVQMPLRKWGVASVLSSEDLSEKYIRNTQADGGASHDILRVCYRKIQEYLHFCHKNCVDTPKTQEVKKDIQKIVESLTCTDAQKLFSIIRNEILDYRERLITYCDEINEEKP